MQENYKTLMFSFLILILGLGLFGIFRIDSFTGEASSSRNTFVWIAQGVCPMNGFFNADPGLSQIDSLLDHISYWGDIVFGKDGKKIIPDTDLGKFIRGIHPSKPCWPKSPHPDVKSTSQDYKIYCSVPTWTYPAEFIGWTIPGISSTYALLTDECEFE